MLRSATKPVVPMHPPWVVDISVGVSVGPGCSSGHAWMR